MSFSCYELYVAKDAVERAEQVVQVNEWWQGGDALGGARERAEA